MGKAIKVRAKSDASGSFPGVVGTRIRRGLVFWHDEDKLESWMQPVSDAVPTGMPADTAPVHEQIAPGHLHDRSVKGHTLWGKPQPESTVLTGEEPAAAPTETTQPVEAAQAEASGKGKKGKARAKPGPVNEEAPQ